MKTKTTPDSLAPTILRVLQQGDYAGLDKLLADKDLSKITMDENGSSILHAAFKNEINISLLLEKYPNLIDIVDNDGKTILHYFSDSHKSDIKNILELRLDLVNQLDNFGNSPLYYSTLDALNYTSRILFDHGGACIKAGTQTKSHLHLEVALKNEFLDFELLVEDWPYINVQDEYGKTPLHYALEHRKDDVISALLESGLADVNIPDRYGRTPLHHMAMLGMDLKKYFLNTPEIRDRDDQGLSLLAMACYGGNKKNYEFLKSSDLYPKDEFDQKIIKMIDSFDYKKIPDYAQGLNQQQALVMMACARKMHHSQAFFIDDYVKNNLLKKNQTTAIKFKKGRVIGIELEYAHIPEFSLVPTHVALGWFDILSKQDHTVLPSILMSVPADILPKSSMEIVYPELITKPIYSKDQLDRTLECFGYLHNSGAMVNKTTGFHVHVNINGGGEMGSITDSMNLGENKKEEIELFVIKQVMMNFAAIEPLLQGFMRWGDSFDVKKQNNNHHGGNLIAPMILEFMKMTKISDIRLIENYDRNHTLNALSAKIDGKDKRTQKEHGTLEFRFHEGTTDPIIIKSWINCVNRLVDISVAQVQKKINENDLDDRKITAYEGIENLVYILIAEREYQRTWDKKLGTPGNAYVDSAYVDPSGEAKQTEIQKSPLYNMFQIVKSGSAMDLKKYYDEHVKDQKSEDKIQIMSDLKTLVEFASKWPGMADEPIAADAIKFINELSGPSSSPDHAAALSTQPMTKTVAVGVT